MLELKNVSFSYNEKKILDNINVTFEPRNVYAIKGESGSGKTTLLSILAGLDKRYTGKLVYNNQELLKSSFTKYNQNEISIIFQDNNLIHYLSILDNIKQSCIIKNKSLNSELLENYIAEFNLGKLDLKSYPKVLSGGEQQRIAIIRSLISDTKIILADEPTASLDKKNANIIFNNLKFLAKQENKIVIIVTHDNSVSNKCDVVYKIENKKLT